MVERSKFYQPLKEKLVQVVRDYVKEAGGISLEEIEHLLGDGQVYTALWEERVIFCEPEPEKNQPGQEQ